ncbi:Ammonia transport outward protein 2 [Rhodotorula toruloides]|nr:Ammonia transport outward protein 2 [Rhodotorula toruloides]
MASTTGSSLHNGADVEKTAGVNHAANGAHGQHGVTGVSTGSPAYASQEGGAPFNLRNITPGGHPLDRSQPAFPTYHRRFANPAPLGLCGFALTTFMLSLINVKTRGVTVPNVVVGPALFYGGLAQLLAGMWEFATGNTFGATAFSSYGAFWLAYAFIVSPWSAIASSYEAEGMFGNGVAFFLWGWFIFTFIMLLASLRSSIALTGVFFFLTITFLLLGIAELGVGNASAIQTAGGAFGLITAFNAWYVAAANLMTPDQSFFVLPVGDMSKKD